jgi:hypothetical protein
MSSQITVNKPKRSTVFRHYDILKIFGELLCFGKRETQSYSEIGIEK